MKTENSSPFKRLYIYNPPNGVGFDILFSQVLFNAQHSWVFEREKAREREKEGE